MYSEIIAPNYHMAHNISHMRSENYLIHSHPFYEFYYFLSGDVYVLYDGTEYVMQPHTFIIFVPNVFHGIHVRSEAPYERHTAHFTEDMIAPDRRDVLMGCLPTEEKLRGGAPVPYIIRDAEKLGILPLMQQYQRLAALPEAARTAVVGTITESMLARYLMFTLEHRPAQSVQPHHGGDRELTPILSYIHRNLTEKLTLEELSERFMISKSKLNNLFHRQMGVTTIEYVNRRRVNYARQLLINGVPAAQAGAAAGFGDYTSFYRAYKKQTGHAPSDDRRVAVRDAMAPLALASGASAFRESATWNADPAPLDIWAVNQSTQVTAVDIGTLRDP